MLKNFINLRAVLHSFKILLIELYYSNGTSRYLANLTSTIADNRFCDI